MSTEMYVYLIIEKFSKDPDEIAAIVGVKPTQVCRKGDLIDKTIMRSKWNSVQYRVDASEKFDLEILTAKLLKKFKNRHKLKKAIGLGKAELVCVFYSSDRSPSVALSSKQIEDLAWLNCGFSLDYYFVPAN